ncbi:MAG TPA: OsmC family protein [Candidatus Dormibacteraeota bacterium]
MEEPPPTNSAQLTWRGGHRFQAKGPSGAIEIASGDDRATLSPMEAMLSAVAACMAVDVVDILGKMRKTVRSYAVDCEGWRRDELPRKFTRIRLTHRVSGPDVDPGSVSRAVDLSQTKYCSAMASLDPAIEVENVIAVEVLA